MWTEKNNSIIASLQSETAGYLNRVLKEADAKSEEILLLLSGGSNLDYLNLISEGLSNNVTICVLDERFTADPTKNNMAQIESKAPDFYRKAEKFGCKFIDTKVKNGETREALAGRFNQSLLEWFSDNSNGKVIMTVGIGVDGHVSGMKPLPEESFTKLFDNGKMDDLVVGYDASSVDPDNPQRVTTTINFFRRIKDTAEVIVYAINKGEALKKVTAENGKLNETPARILNEMKNVTLFTNSS